GRFKKTDAENSAAGGAAAGLANAGIRRNAGMTPLLITKFCPMTSGAEKALNTAAQKLNLSGRAYHGILRTARTIADLDGKDSLEAVHVLEAVEHRRLGDDPWDIFTM
ncbi:MAG: hypothetical protein FWD78_12370, partial [Treponema sp.]|nr:hypothetical protein [Treponema sp.]